MSKRICEACSPMCDFRDDFSEDTHVHADGSGGREIYDLVDGKKVTTGRNACVCYHWQFSE
jgi:hypothetical protein